MNSINSNQKVGDHTDLMRGEAIEKMRFLIAQSSGSCFFCNSKLMNFNYSTPISVLKSESNGDLWFVSPKDCFKNMEITQDFEVILVFPGASHSEFLELEGRVKICDDTNQIKEPWKPMVKSWLKEDLDDPKISINQFKPEKGYYWDDTKSNIVELNF